MSLLAHRYEELLVWAGAALSYQGLNEQAVSQMLQQLSQPVEREDVLREVGQTEEVTRPGQASEARRSCR